MKTLRVLRAAPDVTLPTYGSDGAVGLDLRAYTIDDFGEPKVITVQPGHRQLFLTGLRVVIPDGFYGRIAPRSGLALRFGIDIMAGVIDPDYRGEVGVILINHGITPFSVSHGDRIAQLVLERAERLPVVEIDDELFSHLSTLRAAGGYGSTGVA